MRPDGVGSVCWLDHARIAALHRDIDRGEAVLFRGTTAVEGAPGRAALRGRSVLVGVPVRHHTLALLVGWLGLTRVSIMPIARLGFARVPIVPVASATRDSLWLATGVAALGLASPSGLSRLLGPAAHDRFHASQPFLHTVELFLSFVFLIT